MPNSREYCRSKSAVFCKTTDQWGGLSNMAKGYSLHVNGIDIQSSELLYQAMRFTGHPDIQKTILSQKNPMRGKIIAREHTDFTRVDWEEKRIVIMKWVVHVKLCQNWESFLSLLLSTENKDIVEYSKKDSFWGAHPVDRDTLSGTNALGRILMELRYNYRQYGRDFFRVIHPPKLPDFLLLGKTVLPVLVKTYGEQIDMFTKAP